MKTSTASISLNRIKGHRDLLSLLITQATANHPKTDDLSHPPQEVDPGDSELHVAAHSSAWMASAWSPRIAACSGVTPEVVGVSAAAPSFESARMAAACPFCAALNSGVAPALLGAEWLAPLLTCKVTGGFRRCRN